MPASLYRLDRSAVMGGGARGRHLVRADISFAADDSIRDFEGAYLPVIKAWGRRSWIDTLLNDYYERIKRLTMTAEFEQEILNSLEEPSIEYVGNEACSSCHAAETRQWTSTPHARARETLVAATSDHDTQCQACHSTGFGYRTGFATPKSSPQRYNVGCEACHGAGAVHAKNPSGRTDNVPGPASPSTHNSPRFDYATCRPRSCTAPRGDEVPRATLGLLRTLTFKTA
jgi:hypothetical protein